MEWQKINTAPQDGTSILVANSDKVTLAWWEETRWTELMVWNSVRDNYEPQDLGFTPDYWAPVPKPPCQNNPCKEEGSQRTPDRIWLCRDCFDAYEEEKVAS